MHPDQTNWFLTLTIDDKHLTFGREGYATTNFDDVSEFVKRLREHWSRVHGVKSGIRFYACNEYGDKTMRPHYHMLVFGLPLYDLDHHKMTLNGDELFKSRELDGLWQKGFVDVAEFNWNTAAYTARYVMKKVDGIKASEYEALDIERESVRMSRRPGIARPFLDHHVESIYDLDEIVLPSGRDGSMKVISPPKYFDKVLEQTNPALFEYVKNNRERIQALRDSCSKQQQGYDPIEYLNNKKYAKDQQLKIFQRNAEY